MALNDFRAVIFDLDGLVLDSEPGYIAAWRMAAAAMGHRLDEVFCAGLTGLQGPEVFRRLQDVCGDDLDLQRFSRLSREHWLSHVQQQPIAVKPGFRQLVDCLAGYCIPFALATNSRRQDAMYCLENAGLAGTFALMACRDDVENGKPAPDLIFLAAQRMAVAAQHCLVLEDSPIGVAAAKQAGAACLMIPSQAPPDPQACRLADRVMADLSQVAEFISATFSPSI